MTSPFGVEHTLSKSDALGTPESILGHAHARGEHADKTFRRCPKCSAGAFKTVKAGAAVARKAS